MHKDLEKYAGMALQGIMANPAYVHFDNEVLSDKAMTVARSLAEKLAIFNYQIANPPKADEEKEIVLTSSDQFMGCDWRKGHTKFKLADVKPFSELYQNRMEFKFLSDKNSSFNLYIPDDKAEDLDYNSTYDILVTRTDDVGFEFVEAIPHTPEEILTIRDGVNFVAEEFNGKKVRFVGCVALMRSNFLTVELDDKTGTMFDIHLNGKPKPTIRNNGDLYYVYATISTKGDGWKYLFDKIEHYIEIRDGTITVERAIELIEQGKTAEVITLEAEDVFKENRESIGDKRAAWKALEYSLLAHGIQKQEVEDKTSSNQFESISQLIVDYIFAKYQ